MPSNIPSMRSLMDDPTFRAYMKRVPRRLMTHATGEPWQIWVNRGEGRWGTVLKPTYADAWKVFVHHFKADDNRDVTLVSRRTFYAPPGEWYKVKVRGQRRPAPGDPSTSQLRIEDRWRQTFHWDGTDLHWCGRCRRPSYWMPLYDSHHALKRFPAVSTEDNYRCIICGVRWISQPDIAQMVRVEVKP